MHTFGKLFLTAILCLGSFSILFAAETAKVVVTVNDVALTEGDLSEEIQRILPKESGYHSGVTPEKMKEIRVKALAALVDKELQYQDALVKGLKLSDDALDEEFNKFKQRFKGDFSKQMADAGFNKSSLKRLLERRILNDKIKLQMVDQKVNVNDEKARDYYESNKSKYMKPQEFVARHILVKIDPSANDEERAKRKEKAESILKKLKDGADFAELAEKESDDMSRIKGGALKTFHLGQTEPKFEDAVKKMKPGEISGLVETIYGLHIIKLEEMREPRQLQFDELKEKIRASLREQEEKSLYQQWMGELKAKAKIVYPAEG